MKQKKFIVYNKGNKITEEVYYDEDMTEEDVKKSLINHDGYPSDTKVRGVEE